MTIIRKWCDGRVEVIPIKEAMRILRGEYDTYGEIFDLLSSGETLQSCAAEYYREDNYERSLSGNQR